ncbi:ABC transporter permease [Spirosoma sp. BT702]|uniref:ABC transporter permease n=1 Tax=Spirosoma profusum TaxID=2771354 RepID=A0A927ATE1_9BACT|nr:ABC transporter permease [Spirosoma profusum]MBD2699972.1 ABC transporter permease [Spirosoma profusum]
MGRLTEGEGGFLRPPRWADWLLNHFSPYGLEDELQGDMLEMYTYWVKTVGLSRARWRYVLAVMRLIRPFSRPRTKQRNDYSHPECRTTFILHPDMLRNYIKVAWRNLWRHKLYSLINIGGLALSLTSSTFVGLWVYDERSYDTFHNDADRIYRIAKDFVTRGGARTPDATTPAALVPALQNELPEIQAATRLYPNWGQKYLIKQGDQRFYEEGVYRVDPNFFTVFSFPFLSGNAQTALATPKSIVLTDSAAHKYFGNENPMGKRLTLDANLGDFIVSGVLANIPSNTHFTFDFLIPLRTLGPTLDSNWKTYNFYTYVKLKPNANAESFTTKVQSLVKHHQPDDLNQFYIQPLTRIHLTSKLKWELAPNGDQSYVRILSYVALFVLIVAAINYINLATARAARRAREVGVRKVAGAHRQSLIGQFLGEGVLFALMAGLIAIGLLFLLLPFFNQFVEKQLSLSNQQGWMVSLFVMLLASGTGLLAGIYPALVLSSYEPVQVLKGQNLPSSTFSRLRQGLVTGQFAVSAGLIIGTIIVTQQLHFLRTSPLGFDKEQVMVLPNVGGLTNLDALRQELVALPGVSKTGAASDAIGQTNSTMSMALKGTDKGVTVNFITVDNQGLDVLGIQLKQGRLFSTQFPSDSTTSLLVNETAARHLDLNHPLGSIINTNLQGNYRTVVGVVKDFHYSSLHQTIQPFAFLLGRQNLSNLLVKLNSSNVEATIDAIQHKWDVLVPGRPFSYSFIDERFAALHHADTLFEHIFTGITLIALLIACLGLFALATFMTERRTKEIGVRKVLGASELSIVALITRDFLQLVLLATLLASPVAYYFMSGWLQGFAYKINIEWWMFALAGLLAMVIALLTVSYQSIKAALMNPVKSLRSD